MAFDPDEYLGGSAAKGFDPDAYLKSSTPSQGLSLGPISDVGELGARGINWLAQQLPESIRPAPRQDQPLGTEFRVGGFAPSAKGIARSVYETGKGAVTLPGDVYAGRVDPLSEEGIRRAADLASLTPLSTLPSAAYRAPTGKALAAAELERQGDIGYNTLREGARTTAVPPQSLDTIVNTVRQHTLENGPSPKLAPKAYAEIEGLRTPRAEGDLGDLLDTRRNLMGIVREGGQEGTAALKAVQAIEDHLGPNMTNIARNLDKNWAIMRGSQEVDAAVKNAVAEAMASGSGGNVGNKIKQALRPMLKNEKLSPEVRAAVENAVHAGTMTNLLRAIAIFDPTTHKLGMWGHLMALPGHLVTGGTSALPQAALAGGGYAARAMYDRIMRNRAATVSEAMRGESPLSMAQPGFAPGGIAGVQGSPPLPLLPFAEYQQRRDLQY